VALRLADAGRQVLLVSIDAASNLDTAPTGHTSRLLGLPKAWTGFLAGNDRGASCLGPHSGLKMQEARFNAALRALSDPALTRLCAKDAPGAVSGQPCAPQGARVRRLQRAAALPGALTLFGGANWRQAVHNGRIQPSTREIAMTTQELAQAFTDLLKSGKSDEAGRTYWSDDIVSMEAMEGDMAVLKGRKAVDGKGAWWYANNEVHGMQVEGPFVHGSQFVVRFGMDVTPKGGKRMKMDEVGLYTVKDGKIVEERFFFGSQS